MHNSLNGRQQPSGERAGQPIAIIGIGCRLPGGVLNATDYWNLLINGVDAVEEVPADRWDQFKFYDPEPGRQGKIITKWGGFVRDIDQFDPEFFGISPREAASMDPQQRLILESAWEALEDAGQSTERLAGTDVGVFVGVSTFDYGLMQNSFNDVSGAGPYTNTGQALSICANRLSFLMDWKGPSFSVDTACSSSLLACHMAINSIWRGESSMAMVSGVNFICAPSTYVGFTAMGMLSPDGRCKAFDASANGFVRAEGGCSVLLKPLDAAIQDGDPIYALISASACNQDGHTQGLTMPSQSSQEKLVRTACEQANVSPNQVRYVEAHGTGTPVGDPIEINAIGSVVGKQRTTTEPCYVGSVKANIGHLEAGSGIAGLIKTALVLKTGIVPPNIHFDNPNENIDFDGLNLKVPTEPTTLTDEGEPAYAGINSFGFGGTNVHLILKQHANDCTHGAFDVSAARSTSTNGKPSSSTFDKSSNKLDETQTILFPISARSSESVREMAKSYIKAMEEGGIWSNASFEDIAHSVTQRRSHHAFRATVACHCKESLKEQLQEIVTDEDNSWLVIDPNNPAGKRPLAVVFSGQGPQWWAMGRELMQSEPVFRSVIDRCEKEISKLGPWSLIEELMRDEETSRINETTYAQPAIFAIQIGLWELWKSWGIAPEMIVGHSVGEISAAYASGILTFEDAVKVIYHRGRTMGVVKCDGAMLAVSMSPEKTTEFIRTYEGKLCLAAINGPSTVTISGDESLIDQVEKELLEQGEFARKLQVNYAFHSHQMDPVKDDLLEALADIEPGEAKIPMISTVTGRSVTGPELVGDYWWQNVRQPVQFVKAMNQLIQQDYSLLLEISPHPVLAGAIGECFVAMEKKANVVTSLRRGESERPQMLSSLGKLYAWQCDIDWTTFVDQGKFIGVPAYPWNKQSYWSESNDSQVSRLPCVGHPILGARLPGSRLVYQGFIDVRAQPFAVDHKIQGHVLMPGTGFVEIGLALGKEIYGEGNFVLSDVQLLKAAFMPEKETLMSHTFLDSRTGKFFIETQPLGQPDRPWTVHCVGNLRERPPVEASVLPDLDEVRKRCDHPVPSTVFYDFFRKCGFPFGPSFKGLTQINLGTAEMIGRVEVPEECDDFDEYLFHPAVLDACLQGNFGCFMTHNRKATNLGDMQERIRKAEIFMPSGYDEIRLYRKPSKQMWTYVRMHERFKDSSNSDVFIFDDEGELIAEVRGFRETLVGTVEGTAEIASGMLYEYEWRLGNHPGASPNYFVPKLDQPLLQGHIDNNATEHSPSEREEQRYLEQLRSVCTDLKAGDDSLDQLRELFWNFPQFYSRTALVARCAAALPEIQNGNVDPKQLTHPDGSIELKYQIASASEIGVKTELKIADIVANLFHDMVAGQQVRILDVKGDTARLASAILDRLPAEQVSYLFADRDEESFNFAGEVLQQYPQVEFKSLDIESGDWIETAPDQDDDQELPESAAENAAADAELGNLDSTELIPVPQYELIIFNQASNETSDIKATIAWIKQQLAPGGILLIVDDPNDDPIEAMTFGLSALQSTAGPRERQQWLALLDEAGFETTTPLNFNENINVILTAKNSCEQVSDPLDIEASEKADAQQEPWLIFCDEAGFAEQLIARLTDSEIKFDIVCKSDEYAELAANKYEIDPANPSHFEKLFAGIDNNPGRVVYLWNLDVPAVGNDNDDMLSECQRLGVLAPVNLCKAWTEAFGAEKTDLWMVSRGAHSIESTETSDPGQWPLWGNTRVMMNEFPHLHCRLADLTKCDEAELDQLFFEIQNKSTEDEISFRGQARYVHRLVGSSLSKFADVGEEPGGAYRLHLSEYGTLDGMRLRPAELRDPLDLPTLVEVEVHASALNFSDVMKALALYPGLAEGFVPVGIECAGVITKVGDEVTDFKPGDEVVCITPMSISSHTYTDQRFVAKKPKHLSMAEAATLPIAFLTAHYALHYMGHLEADEKTLINAATGGVGLAAIQLAQQAGAELFATAGTDIKRSLLHFLGINNVMNSRTLAFADEVMELTENRGVDVILNSLSGEAIAKGMAILADYGRFLEIGKRDIYANTNLGMRAFRKNVSFAAIDLDRGLREKPDLCSKMFRQIIADANAGTIKPLPHQVFPISQLVDAFRFMAGAKHIGKVIIEMKDQPIRPVRDSAETQIEFCADASYLLTGGLGGLGTQLATWMVDHGARTLIFASRSGVKTPEAEKLVADLEKREVKVVIEKLDVSDRQQVDQLIARIETDLPPLKGVMHAAAVLDDGLVLQLDAARIDRVCKPKLDGAWHLHNATLNCKLDFFVCHSSTSSIFGNAGQANYSAANAFLDGLAEYRKSIGLPATTVNWGYLGDLGLAAGDESLAKKFEQQGVKAVPPAEGLPILGKLMSFDVNQMSIMKVDWTRLRQLARTMAQSPRFEQMMRSSGSEDAKGKSGSDIRNLILATDPDERVDVMLGIVRDKVARVMGTRPEKVEVDRSLMDLGLDSLMGFELRNWIEGELRINIPVVELMQGPTVQKLTSLILVQLEKGDSVEDDDSAALNSELLSAHLGRFSDNPQQAAAFAALISVAEDMKSELQGDVDLPAELVMKPELESALKQLSEQPRELPPEIQNVFLTGGTGFLGAYILHQLLETNADLKVTCLVRADDESNGAERILANLEKYGLWSPGVSERIQAVAGDVAEPEFGLSTNTYLELAGQADMVLHNAAGVNFLHSYQQLKAINVGGTQNVMQFALAQKLKYYHHVSTLFTFSILDHLELATIEEMHNPKRHEFIYGGYLQSKWVSDQLVQMARDMGLPTAIYRPGIVTGDSKTGIHSEDVISRSLASVVQLGCCPADAMRFTFTPVDYVGQAIARLSLRDDSVGNNFHLTNDPFIDWPTVIPWLEEMGYEIESLDYSDWLDRLQTRSSESADTMLSGLLPVIPEVQLSGQSIELPPPSFDCQNSLSILRQEGVVCPEINRELLKTYVNALMLMPQEIQ